MTTKLKLADITQFFAEPGRAHPIDPVHPVTGRGLYSGETIEEMRERYPEVVIVSFDELDRIHRDTYTVAPHKITAERWDYMLNVLPPVHWTNRRGAETFKLSERTSGEITAILCRIGDEYWEMQDSIFLSHEDIVNKINTGE